MGKKNVGQTMNPKMDFQVDSWAAWAPGISTPEEWRDFYHDNRAITPEVSADVAFLPAMQRRRLSTLARAAFHVIEKVMENADLCPSIFCSTYGETQRTYGILSDIAQQQEISPTAFSLSVHNAISGQFTIFFNNTHATTAMAPSENDYLIAFADALGQLNENAKSILLVFYEEALPEFYQPFARSTDYPCAVALRISKPAADPKNVYSLGFNSLNASNDNENPIPILQLIRFLSDNSTSLELGKWILSR
jgi:hypothetical protein